MSDVIKWLATDETLGLVKDAILALPNATQTAADNANAAAQAANTAAANVAGNLADNYSNQGTYAVGDYVCYSGALYKCNTAIDTAEEWTAAHWTAVKMGDDVSDLKSALTDIVITSSSSKNLLDTSNTISGILAADGSITANANYVTCPLFPVSAGKYYVANVSLRSILFFDSAMQPLSDSYDQFVTQAVIAPPNSNYFRVSISKNATNVQLEEGTTPTDYTPFIPESVLNTTAYYPKTIDAQTIKNTVSIGTGKNKLDTTQNTINVILASNTGEVSVNSNQATSNFIPIAFGMTLCISGVLASSSDRWPASVICFYDQNQNFTRGINISSRYEEFQPNFAFPAERGERFFRISYRKTNTDMQVEYASTPTVYEAFEGTIIFEPMLLRGFIYDAEPPAYINPWYGKKIIADGDSISHDQGRNNYWQFCTAKTLELDYEWNSNWGTPGAGFIGIAGSRIADENGGNDPTQSIVLRYTNYPDGADIVIIAGGSNDWAHSAVPIGASDSTDISTFNGALNTLLPGLKQKYPAASIIMMTPIKRGAYGDTNTLGLTEEQFVNALIAKCREYGVYCCDMWGTCPINPNIPAMLSAYYGSDNVHPNPAGQAVMGKTVTGFVRTLA